MTSPQTAPYNPTADKRLIGFSMAFLLNDDRIIYLDNDPPTWAHLKKLLSKIGDDLHLFVDKDTNLAVPLRMQLYDNRGVTLIPNQPLGALLYQCPGFMMGGPRFHALGVEIAGIEIDNRMCAPAGDEGAYFPKKQSGWKNDQQGRTLEARVDYTFHPTQAPSPTSVIAWTTIRYSL